MNKNKFKRIKQILDLKFYILRLRKNIYFHVERGKQLESEIIVRDMDIKILANRVNQISKERNDLLKYHRSINHMLPCPMCCQNAIFHKVIGASGRCMVCKDDTNEIFSTTCGHIACYECASNLINHYNLLK